MPKTTNAIRANQRPRYSHPHDYIPYADPQGVIRYEKPDGTSRAVTPERINVLSANRDTLAAGLSRVFTLDFTGLSVANVSNKTVSIPYVDLTGRDRELLAWFNADAGGTAPTAASNQTLVPVAITTGNSATQIAAAFASAVNANAQTDATNLGAVATVTMATAGYIQNSPSSNYSALNSTITKTQDDRDAHELAIGSVAVITDASNREDIYNGSTFTKARVTTGKTTKAGGTLAVPITNRAVVMTTGGAESLTLANGVNGQRLNLILGTDGGDGTLTPTTKTGFTSIVFADAGDIADLEFVDSTVGWIIVGTAGVAAPPVIVA